MLRKRIKEDVILYEKMMTGFLYRTFNFWLPAIVIILLGSCSGNKSKNINIPATNVIFLIGDGMGLAQVSAGMTVNHGYLNLERCTQIGLIKTQSGSNYITDSGAGATAFACGKKTYNGAIGVGMDSLPLKNIVEILSKEGYNTGVVATSSIVHATPAGFVAHNINRNNYAQLALDFVYSPIDVFIGGGMDVFKNRPDGLNLIDSLEAKGFRVYRNLDSAKVTAGSKLAVLTAPEHNPKISEGRGAMLSKATSLALDALPWNSKGFFLMVEGSQIDWGGHDNDIGYITSEMIDFDQAVGIALDYAEAHPHTLVVVTADHETGGLGINGGDIKAGKVEAAFTTKHHTGIMVPVYAFGDGAEKFSGIYENTEIFFKLLEAMQISADEKN